MNKQSQNTSSTVADLLWNIPRKTTALDLYYVWEGQKSSGDAVVQVSTDPIDFWSRFNAEVTSTSEGWRSDDLRMSLSLSLLAVVVVVVVVE